MGLEGWRHSATWQFSSLFSFPRVYHAYENNEIERRIDLSARNGKCEWLAGRKKGRGARGRGGGTEKGREGKGRGAEESQKAYCYEIINSPETTTSFLPFLPSPPLLLLYMCTLCMCACMHVCTHSRIHFRDLIIPITTITSSRTIQITIRIHVNTIQYKSKCHQS